MPNYREQLILDDRVGSPESVLLGNLLPSFKHVPRVNNVMRSAAEERKQNTMSHDPLESVKEGLDILSGHTALSRHLKRSAKIISTCSTDAERTG